MEFQKLIELEKIKEDEMEVVVIGDREIAVTLHQGEYRAFDDLCTHADASLAEGCVENGEVECPVHFAKFCLKTGAVTEPPAFEDMKVYETKVEGDFLYIKI